MTVLFLTGTELQVIEANAQIEVNYGIPNGNGTDRWAVPTKMYEADEWYIIAPPPNGWNEYSYEEGMYGVLNVGVALQESQPNWFPPPPPPEAMQE